LQRYEKNQNVKLEVIYVEWGHWGSSAVSSFEIDFPFTYSDLKE